MDRPYIERFRVQNYGCVTDATLELTPLHALIGPNDSGKSTLLRALRTVTALASDGFNTLGARDASLLHDALRESQRRGPTELEAYVQAMSWQASFTQELVAANHVRAASYRGASETSATVVPLAQGSNIHLSQKVLGRALQGSQLLRLEADALRQRSALIPDGMPLRLQDSRGRGLPAVYDAIVTRDLNSYVEIGRRFSELFPTVKSLSLKNVSATEKALGIQLHDGTFVGADFMSEGMLYFLAYAALPYLSPTAMLLVEEPENGLHPAHIKDVMKVLRDISKTTQVVLATHSPLVVNELAPDEVTVVTRTPDKGTKATRIKDTPNFAERANVYALGELWVSYADGNLETPLFKEPEPTADAGEPVEWSETGAR